MLVRIKGQAPIAATVYELEKLRCNLCGDVFTAAAPEGVGEEKYDETAASMIAMLRYGSGFPWNRLKDYRRIWASRCRWQPSARSSRKPLSRSSPRWMS